MSSRTQTAEPRIALVVAVARNGVIGRAGRLPWSLPSDLKRFRQITMGHPCLMGRKTFESIGKPLKGRDNIVISRRGMPPVEGVVVVPDLDAALVEGKARAVTRGVEEIMVIGGGDIYRQTLPLASRLYLTQVEMDVDGDTVFPPLDPGHWREAAREIHPAGPNDSAGFSLITLDRV